MWCRSCQQDVPGAHPDDSGGFSCPRCGAALPVSPPEPVTATPATAGRASCAVSARLVLLYNRRMPDFDWEVDEELRRLEALLGSDIPPPPEKTTRVDVPHLEVSAPHRPKRRAAEVVRAVEDFQTRGVLPLLTWIALLLGTMTVVCGGMLVLWSWFAGRPELWRIGQPIALGGVCSLVVAMALHLDRSWEEDRSEEPHTTSRRTAAEFEAAQNAAS